MPRGFGSQFSSLHLIDCSNDDEGKMGPERLAVESSNEENHMPSKMRLSRTGGFPASRRELCLGRSLLHRQRRPSQHPGGLGSQQETMR